MKGKACAPLGWRMLFVLICFGIVGAMPSMLPAQIVINEILADPDGTTGDANGDGTVDTSQDEFVELVNTSGADLDISGWEISDAVGLRHLFPAGTVVPADCAIVVFGGGTPTGTFGDALVQTSTNGFLGFNNGGDTVTVTDASAMVVATETYGSEGGNNQSITRDPDLTGAFVEHTMAGASGGTAFSPGTQLDGTSFSGCGSVPTPALVINEILADPDGTTGDANGDGTVNTSADEFVELVNTSGADLDVSNWEIADGFGVRHVFPMGTVIPADCAIVVFGAGMPTGTFGDALVQTSSTGQLGLNNGGDTVTVTDASALVVATETYGSEGGNNQSITRDPDLTGAFVEHTMAGASGGTQFSPGTQLDGANFAGCGSAPVIDLVINEILADPDGTTGDANGDGSVSSTQDEFVELVNNGSADLDVSGWELADGFSLRHVFPAGTVIPADCAIVVFGGGMPSGTFGNALVQIASTGGLGLNNSGDTITVTDTSAMVIASETYGSEGGNNQSITRDPDITGAFVEHTMAGASGGTSFSPGTQLDGTDFSGCGGLPCVPVTITTITATPPVGPAPLAVDFAVTTDGTGPFTFAWDLDGDGMEDDSTDETPSFNYMSNGVFVVTVTVTNACGTATASVTVAVLDGTGVAINEIRQDQPSTDVDEYFELISDPNVSLDGLTYIVIGDGSGGSGVIENVTDLTGSMTDANGFFVAAESTFTLGVADLVTSLNFETSDNLTHLLVAGFVGTNGQDLDTNDDGVLDLEPWAAVIDRIAIIEEENPPASTEFHYGPPTVGPDGPFVPGAVRRCPDRFGSFVISEFDPLVGLDTPGALNDCAIADVVINEIRIDQPSNDDDEYFELAGTPDTQLIGLTYLVIGDGATADGTIESALDISQDFTNAAGFFTVAESTFTLGTADRVAEINFENSDNVTHLLVYGFSGTVGQDLDTDDDGVLDATPWVQVIDLIALVEEENPPTGTEFHYGPPSIGPDDIFVPGHVKRCPDITGDFEIGVFDPADVDASDTPGGPNACCEPVSIDVFSVDVNNGNAPLTVTFSATLLGTDPFTWSWDSGDGQMSSDADTVQFTYNTAGTFTATLTVTNDCGTDTVSIDITVCEPLAVDFSADVTLGVADTCVSFTDLTTGDIAGYSWDLDGDSLEDSTDANPSFQYGPGTFDVTLTVTGVCGRVETLTMPSLIQSVEIGDCNVDGTVDVADAIQLAQWLFAGGAAPGCLNACDVNGDGLEDLGDVVYQLANLFGGGPAPVAPPACTLCN